MILSRCYYKSSLITVIISLVISSRICLKHYLSWKYKVLKRQNDKIFILLIITYVPNIIMVLWYGQFSIWSHSRFKLWSQMKKLKASNIYLEILSLVVITFYKRAQYYEHRSSVAHSYAICFIQGKPGFKSRQGR